jgi:TonB family protein
MKNLFTGFFIVFGFFSAFAQTSSGQKTPPAATASATPSAAMQEADKLSVEVVKLFKDKKYNEALPLAQKVLAMREAELGKNHLAVARAYQNLGYLQSKIGNRKESESSFENAYDIFESNQPLSVTDEKTFADLLEIVALHQAIDGDLSKGEKKLQRAVGLREKLTGRDSLETSNSLQKLSDLYEAKGDYEKAAPLLMRVFDIKTKKLGAKHDDAELAFQSLSCTLTKLKREQELTEIKNRIYPPEPTTDATVIKGGVINGKALRLITPPYPAEAKNNRITGTVQVKVTIDETGKVIRACAMTGARELQRASEIASYQSTFTPTILSGKPVRVTGIIVYNFRAQ